MATERLVLDLTKDERVVLAYVVHTLRARHGEDESDDPYGARSSLASKIDAVLDQVGLRLTRRRLLGVDEDERAVLSGVALAASIDENAIEIRAWPPGAIATSKAVHVLHRPTGVAVVVGSESSRGRNQDLACERVKLLLTEATSPGMWSGR